MPLILSHPEETTSAGPASIEIGLLNNLSDAGLERGERQIVELLSDVVGPNVVRLKFFSLPSIERGHVAKARISMRYTPFTRLMRGRLDGLIVTGCEPHAETLPKEAFWRELTEVIDWAEHNTRSTIWSCLAAHAAVLHLDGVERQRLSEKRAGLFRVATVGQHPLLDGVPTDLRVPHSRWNGLDASKLTAAGYQILTQGEHVGIDTFVKSWRSLFIYLQGHPEYDAGALGREYRRDIRRYFEGSSRNFPKMPEGYFDPSTELALAAFAKRARGRRDPHLADTLPIRNHTPAVWPRGLARTLFRNWLLYIDRSILNRLPSHTAD